MVATGGSTVLIFGFYHQKSVWRLKRTYVLKHKVKTETSNTVNPKHPSQNDSNHTILIFFCDFNRFLRLSYGRQTCDFFLKERSLFYQNLVLLTKMSVSITAGNFSVVKVAFFRKHSPDPKKLDRSPSL